jgi:lipoate-protein ligase A
MMLLVDQTLATPEENLALDEALLEQAERSGEPSECLRLWESPVPLVVVGRSSKVDVEVNLAACQALGLPVLRRVSGGGAIVAGPGCLMYALVLSYQLRPELRAIDAAHAFVLHTLARAIGVFCEGVARQGTSDLAISVPFRVRSAVLQCRAASESAAKTANGPSAAPHGTEVPYYERDAQRARKFSGNSMRACRDHFLYHGTLLYDFPLPLVEQCLGQPPREPEYRAGRSHTDFIANLPIRPTILRQILIDAWGARTIADWPRDLVRELAARRYARPEWNRSGALLLG